MSRLGGAAGAAIVGNDDGVPQQPLMADRAPQCAFAGDSDGIGRNFQGGQTQRLQMPLPRLGANHANKSACERRSGESGARAAIPSLNRTFAALTPPGPEICPGYSRACLTN